MQAKSLDFRKIIPTKNLHELTWVIPLCFSLAACQNNAPSDEGDYPNKNEVSLNFNTSDLNSEFVKAGSFLPDFSYAGYAFGLDTPTTPASAKLISVADYGAVPDDGIDDTQAIQNALASSNEIRGHVVLNFEPGQYEVTNIIEVTRGDITLTGNPDSNRPTTLHFPDPIGKNGDSGRLNELREYLIKYDKLVTDPYTEERVVFSEYSWTGGFLWVGPDGYRPSSYLEKYDVAKIKSAEALLGARGQKTLSVNSSESLKTGDWIKLEWYNYEKEKSPLLAQIYGEENLDLVGSHHWTSAVRPVVSQKTTIVAINDNQITIGDPLLHDINGEIPASILPWAPLRNVGIENLNITFGFEKETGFHHGEEGYNAIYLNGVADSWIKNLKIRNADSGILTYDSANVTIDNIETSGDRVAHYSVHMGNVHNILAQNISIKNKVHHSLSFNTQATRSVFRKSEVFQMPTLDQHAGCNHQNLFDQITLHVQPDDIQNGLKTAVFQSGGAGYWQPGHGKYNTLWNIKVILPEFVSETETVELFSLKPAGPGANIIGLHGNRKLKVSYSPTPFIASLNEEVLTVPSLYDFQIRKRKR